MMRDRTEQALNKNPRKGREAKRVQKYGGSPLRLVRFGLYQFVVNKP